MNNDTIINNLCDRYPVLASIKNPIAESAKMIISCFSGGGKLLVCGNGGSCTDADHLVSELMKSFELKRPIKREIVEKLNQISGERGKYLAHKLESSLPTISLCSQTALTTAISNDIDANLVFAQQIIGYGCINDVFIGISTSGNSQNVVDACITAKAMNLKVIGLTGTTGGKMKQYCDVLLNVPEERTAYVQELHLPVIHTLCIIIENHIYGNINLQK